MVGNRVCRVLRGPSWRLIPGAVCVLGSVVWTGVPVASAQDAKDVTAAVHAGALQRRVTVVVNKAPLGSVLRSIAQQALLKPAYNEGILKLDAPVTLALRNVSVSDAFRAALQGTGFVAQVRPTGNVTIERDVVVAVSGIITGRVTSATTKRPLRGVRVRIEGSTQAVETGEEGMYRIVGVAAGTYTLSTQSIGYVRERRSVAVEDGGTATADLALLASVNTLDQVVVTGTVIPTELKAVPNAITVITAKQIEERGITQIQQLFRGDVPGLFAAIRGSVSPLDEVLMYSRGATALSTNSAGTQSGTNPIKTYVDGVEMADPKYLSQIDPKSIERIEILTGPQASTIYGSNALNGVMQIFTKRGTSSIPQLTLNLMSGFIENNFSPARTPQHDYMAQVNGIEGRVSYNAGGSWQYTGPWTPAKQSARFGGFGGARLTLPTMVGPVTADVTLRRTITQSTQKTAYYQGRANLGDIGYYSPIDARSIPTAPTLFQLTGQTLGITLTYAPASWWSHDVGFGQDGEDVDRRALARGFSFPYDTLLSYQQSHTERRSIRYATTARVSLSRIAQITATAGADGWQNLVTSSSGSSLALTGSLTAPTSTMVVVSCRRSSACWINSSSRTDCVPSGIRHLVQTRSPTMHHGMGLRIHESSEQSPQRFAEVMAGRHVRPPSASNKLSQTRVRLSPQFTAPITLDWRIRDSALNTNVVVKVGSSCISAIGPRSS
jgi:hypothetical protein